MFRINQIHAHELGEINRILISLLGFIQAAEFHQSFRCTCERLLLPKAMTNLAEDREALPIKIERQFIMAHVVLRVRNGAQSCRNSRSVIFHATNCQHLLEVLQRFVVSAKVVERSSDIVQVAGAVVDAANLCINLVRSAIVFECLKVVPFITQKIANIVDHHALALPVIKGLERHQALLIQVHGLVDVSYAAIHATKLCG